MNVLLDLDGTLTDPREGFVGSMTHALKSMACTVPAEDVIAGYIGPPLEETIAALLGPALQAQVGEAVARYRHHYSTTGIFENQVYADVPEVLAQLESAGHRLYLATSKPEVFAIRILEHFGLSQFFTGIHGSGMDGTRADKRQLIAYLLAHEALAADTSVMIGDRAHDVRGALANKVVPIGVLWGYGSRAELEAAGAAMVIQQPSELVEGVAKVDRSRSAPVRSV